MYVGIVTLRSNCRIDVDICQTVQVCIKYVGYIFICFLDLDKSGCM